MLSDCMLGCAARDLKVLGIAEKVDGAEDPSDTEPLVSSRGEAATRLIGEAPDGMPDRDKTLGEEERLGEELDATPSGTGSDGRDACDFRRFLSDPSSFVWQTTEGWVPAPPTV